MDILCIILSTGLYVLSILLIELCEWLSGGES